MAARPSTLVGTLKLSRSGFSSSAGAAAFAGVLRGVPGMVVSSGSNDEVLDDVGLGGAGRADQPEPGLADRVGGEQRARGLVGGDALDQNRAGRLRVRLVERHRDHG